MKALVRIIQEQMPYLYPSQVSDEVDEIFKSGKAEYYKSEEFSKHMMNGILDSMSIVCFSAKRDDNLMWSHYSDSHRGICLEFDVSEENGLGGAKSVIYADDYPTVNYYTN